MTTAEMPRGPIIMGMASGTTATAPTLLAVSGLRLRVISLASPPSLSKLTSGLAWLLPLLIMEMAIRNTRIPPPTRKEPMLMPNSLSSQLPNRVKKTMAIRTLTVVSVAVLRRSRRL